MTTAVQTEETQNVCCMKELLKVGFYKSNETGKLYVNYISWVGPGKMGRWTDIEINEKELKKIIRFLDRPDIDGKRWTINDDDDDEMDS